MSEPERMRASDEDRQQIVDLLRSALDEGRLKMDEYVERMGKALEASTYGELAALHDDIPKTGTVARRVDMGTATPRSTHPTPSQVSTKAGGAYQALPTAMKVLWTIWFAAVSINVVVWVLVGLTGGTFPYPWPLWVAGPSGAALFGVSAGIRSIQRSQSPKKAALPEEHRTQNPGREIGTS